MTLSASTALIPADSYMPEKLVAELTILTLSGSDNPLANGGKLVRTVPGQSLMSWTLGTGVTKVTDASPLSTNLPSSITFVLEAAGKRVLELSLRITSYTWGDPTQPRVEVGVTFTGASAAIAPSLTADGGSYSWRLWGKAPMVGNDLEVQLELIQEEVPTEFVDALATTRLAFTNNGGGAQAAVIEVKRFKETVEPT